MMLALVGCEEDPCASKDPASVELGQGTSSYFEPYQDGEVVQLVPAAQGGSGIPVLIRTVGLATDTTVDVDLVTEQDGSILGSFLLEGQNNFCSQDGTGRILGAVVGLDPIRFGSAEALQELHGQEIDLVVTVDDGKESATGTVAVVLETR